MRPCLLTALLVLWLAPCLFAVSNRSISGSQQFTVFCDDRNLRQKLAGAFDEVRSGLFSELSIQLGTPVPIYVNITPRKIVEYNSKTWTMRWLDTPNGARVQLDVLIDESFQEQSIQEPIVGALLLTIKYRDNPPPGGQSYFDAPAWVVEGLSEKIRLQTKEVDSDLYRGLLNAKNVPNIIEWLKIDPARLNTTSLGIYRAYACSLVNFFQSEPNGNKKIIQFLEQAPADPASAVAWLGKAFPNFGANGKNLAKWWTLSLAKLSASDRYTAWSANETNLALEKLLVVNLTVGEEKKTFSLNQFPDFMKLPGRESALSAMQTDLIRLTIHAHPLYRPIMLGYQDILDRLQRDKLKNIDKKLTEMETLRSQISLRLQDVGDYLTWFEATGIQSQDEGEFDGYFRLMQSFQAPRPSSKEPIGRYLDAMEAELKN